MKWILFFAMSVIIGACGGVPVGTTNSAGTTTSGASAGTTNSGSTTSGAVASGSGSTTGGGSAATGAGTTSGSLGTLGAACATTQVDPCAAAGYECSDQLTGASAGTCVLPRQYGECQYSVGCQDGGPWSAALSCTDQDDLPGTTAYCLLYCANGTVPSQNCPDPGSTCAIADDNCHPNPCNVDAGPQPVALGLDNFVFDPNGPFFDPCNAANGLTDPETGAPWGAITNDGICLPFGTGANFRSLCYQSGTAVAGQPCSSTRGGPHPQCVFGQLCVESATDAGIYGDGICLTIDLQVHAAGSAPGAACPLSLGGQDAGGLLVPLSDQANWAVCAQDCTAAGVVCAAGTACAHIPGTNRGACLPP